jgi:hypothetical protein
MLIADEQKDDAQKWEEEYMNSLVYRMNEGRQLMYPDMSTVFQLLQETLEQKEWTRRQHHKILILSVHFQNHYKKKAQSDRLKLQYCKIAQGRTDPIWNWNIVVLPGLDEGGEGHWYLGVIDFTLREFRYYDCDGEQFASPMFSQLQVRLA